ncbi:MAG: membrane protein insertion efficiency factor YidD [Bacilli bacterium]|nr:membrane protein insertion efficiency factor YidD [Bacilli bacterium]
MNKLMIFLIKKYQSLKNPQKKTCRFLPTCSNYALEAFNKFCFFKALLLTIFRILRCNPLSKGGYNPVPKNYLEKYLENFFPEIFK